MCLCRSPIGPPVPCSCAYCLDTSCCCEETAWPKRPCSRGSQDRAEAGAMEERCLQTCSDYNFIQPWTICLPRDGTVPSGLGPPTSIINQEKPHIVSSGLFWWGHFLTWGSFSQVTLGCVKYETNSLTITPIFQPTLQREIGQKSITSL